MKALAGVVALVLVLAVGGVAAYDYATGDVGVLPDSWTNNCSGTPCCSQAEPSCCTDAVCEGAACPATADAPAESPCCEGGNSKKTCPLCEGESQSKPAVAGRAD